jgi:hypothetical protein
MEDTLTPIARAVASTDLPRPPNGITGGFVTKPRSAGVSLHWLNVVLPIAALEHVRGYCDAVWGEGEDRDFSPHRYNQSRKYTNEALICWSHFKGHFLVSIPGDALDLMGAAAYLDMIHVFDDVRTSVDPKDAEVCHATRVDVGWNDTIGVLDLDEIYDARRHVVGTKTFHQDAPENVQTGELTGRALYFGKRGSDGSGRYHRIYDKTLETKGEIIGTTADGEEFHVVRFEAQLGDHWARDAFARMAACKTVPQLAQAMANILVSSIDFRDRGENDARHLDRRPRLDWWQKIHDLLLTETVEISTYKPTPPLQDTLVYMLKTYGRKLATAKIVLDSSDANSFNVIMEDAIKQAESCIDWERSGSLKLGIDPMAVMVDVRKYFSGREKDDDDGGR